MHLAQAHSPFVYSRLDIQAAEIQGYRQLKRRSARHTCRAANLNRQTDAIRIVIGPGAHQLSFGIVEFEHERVSHIGFKPIDIDDRNDRMRPTNGDAIDRRIDDGEQIIRLNDRELGQKRYDAHKSQAF